MSTTAWIVVGLIVAFDLLLLPLILYAVIKGSWMRLQQVHPAAEPATDAVRKNFQSFKIGLLNLGMSVHVAVDERALHLFPAAIIRWFGARPASVPWGEIEVKKRGRFTTHVRIAGADVFGPHWCFELVDPDAD